MNKSEYALLIKRKSCKEKRLLNALIAFAVGGIMGVFAEGLTNLYMMLFGFAKVDASATTCLTIILLTTMFTAFGFFDNLVEKGKCGFIIPTTGFAHSMASATMDYQKEGLIKGIGSNAFKLAGSAILYGIISGFFFAVLGVVFYG